MFGGYSQATLRGRTVVGLGPVLDEKTPVAWTTYLAADDADAVAAAVAAAVGSVLVPPMAIGEEGRMVVAADPTGAFFGLWEAGKHTGSQLVNEPGTVVWNELVSPDLARARSFYTAALGVEWGEEDTGEATPYPLLKAGGRSVGGATTPQPGSPPHWRVYFEVADTEATVARVTELGGRAFTGAVPTPQGPMATFADPQGGVFSVIASGSTE